MESKITTLEGDLLLTNMRRMGNSTRQVDNAIQILFNGSTCVVLDHWEHGRNRQANKHLLRMIVDRIRAEHSWVKFNVVDGVMPEIKLITE